MSVKQYKNGQLVPIAGSSGVPDIALDADSTNSVQNKVITEKFSEIDDMICAVDEGTAQVASVKVDKGEFFRYNDVLYVATADIAVGDTIIPNTNCRATNVATELEDLVEKTLASVTADGVKTYAQLLAELHAITGVITDPRTALLNGNTCMRYATTDYFTLATVTASSINIFGYQLANNTNIQMYGDARGMTFTNNSSTVPTAGTVLKIVRL